MRFGARFEALPRLCGRHQSLVGPACAQQANVQRLLVRLVDIDHGRVGDVRLECPAGPRPVREELAVAWGGVGARIDQKIAWIDAIARAELERLRIAAHHPQRRMRLLQRLYGKLGALSVELLAVIREGLLLAERGTQIIDKLERWRLAQIV